MLEALQHQLTGEATRLIRERQDEKAVFILDKLLGAFPHREDLQTSRAYCLGRMGRLDEAFQVCEMLGSTGATPRIQHLRMFLEKQGAAHSSKPSQGAAPASKASALPDTPNLSRALALKLQEVRRNVEEEFELYRTRESEATHTIQKLRMRVFKRDEAIQDLEERNRELHELLGDLGTEMVALNDPAGLPAPPVKVPLSEDTETKQTIEELERNISERDKTLETTFRKNGELERTVARLRARVDALSDDKGMLETTEEDLRAELQSAREQYTDAVEHRTEDSGDRAQTVLNEARENTSRLAHTRETVQAHIDGLRAEIAATVGSDETLSVENARLNTALERTERLLLDAAEGASGLSGELIAAQETLDRLKAREDGAAAEMRTILDELSSREMGLETLQLEKRALEENLEKFQAEHEARQLEADSAQEFSGRAIEERDDGLRRAFEENMRIEQEFHQAKTQIETLESKERADQLHIESLTESIETKTREFDEVRVANDDLRHRLEVLRKEYDDVASRGTDLAVRERSSVERLLSNRGELADLKRENRRLEELLSEAQSQLTDTLSQKDASALEMTALEAKLTRHEDARIALENEKSELAATLLAAQGRLDEFEARNVELQERADRLTSNGADIEQAHEGLLERHAELQQQGDVHATHEAELERDRDAMLERNAELEVRASALEEQGLELEDARGTLAKRLESQDRQCERLEVQVAELEERGRDLEGERATVTERLESQDRQCASLEAQVVELEELGRALETDRATLTERLESQERERESLESHVTELETRGEGLESDLAGSIEDYGNATREKTDFQEKIGELESRIRELNADSTMAADNISLLVQDLEERKILLEALGQEKAALVQSTEALEAQNKVLVETEERQSSEIKQLEQELGERNESFATLCEIKSELELALSHLKMEHAFITKQEKAAQASVESLTEDLATRDARVEELDSELERLRGEIEGLGQDKLDAASSAGILVGERDEAHGRIDALEEERAGLEMSSARLQAELVEAECREADLLAQSEALRKAMSLQESELGLITREHEEAMRHVGDLSEGLTEREEKLRTLEREKMGLGERITELESELYPMREREVQAEAKIESLEGDLRERTEEYTAAVEAIETSNLRVEDMKLMITEYDRTLVSEKASKDRVSQDLSDLQEKLDEISTNRDAALLHGEQLNKQLAVTQNDLEDAQQALYAAGEEKAALEESLSARRGEIADANAHADDLTRQIGDLHGQVEDVRAGKAGAEEMTQAVELELEALGEKRDEALTEVAHLGKTIQTLEMEVKVADESVKTASNVIGELETSLTSKDGQLEETRTEAHDLHEDVRQLESEIESLHTGELPAALEQKVQALKQVQKMRAEIEMLRNQL